MHIYFRKEIKEGADALTDKILMYAPKIAVFNGKGRFCSCYHTAVYDRVNTICPEKINLILCLAYG